MTRAASAAKSANALESIEGKRLPEIREEVRRSNEQVQDVILLGQLLSPPASYKLPPPLTLTYSSGFLSSIAFTGGTATITRDPSTMKVTSISYSNGLPTRSITYNGDGSIATITEAAAT